MFRCGRHHEIGAAALDHVIGIADDDAGRVRLPIAVRLSATPGGSSIAVAKGTTLSNVIITCNTNYTGANAPAQTPCSK